MNRYFSNKGNALLFKSNK